VITPHIEAVLIITGVCTASALVLFLAPTAMSRRIFGDAPAGPLGTGVMRHWGLLLFCVGALLVYAAFNQAVREPAMVLASVEKLGFAGCVFGTSLRQRPMVSFMAAADVAMVLLYALYFAGA
jgi:hypothetical protein